MTGAQTRDQLEKQIDYANAPEFLIKVTTRDGSGSIAKPAAGETFKKVTDIFDIRFEPLPDFEFVSWQASSQKLAEGQDINDYIEIEDARKAETRVTFKKALEDIVITATVAERAQIISYSPMTSEVLKDSSVLVQFDHDMNEDSIYYTDDDLDALEKSLGKGNYTLIPSKKYQGRFYGYTKLAADNKTEEYFYKNISFVDNETNENLTIYYDEPCFATPKLLKINTVKDHLLGDYTPILVTIDKNFFYTFDDGSEKGKDISMTGSKKWTYQVSDEIDKDKPFFLNGDDDITVSVNSGLDDSAVLSAGKTVPKVSASTVFNRNKKVNLNIKLTDLGSGPDDTFTIVLSKIQDKNYKNITSPVEETVDVNYQRVTSQKGIINKDVDLSSLVKDGLSDGVYKMRFIFRDRCGKSFTYPTDSSKFYYFTIDNAIEMGKPDFNDTSTFGVIQTKCTWTPAADFTKTQIRYKKKSESEWSDYDNFTSVYYKEFTQLNLDTEYDFEMINYDFAGNSQKVECSNKTPYWEELAIIGTPDKTLYFKGESFNTSGFLVYVKLSSGTIWSVNTYTNDFVSTTVSNNKKVTLSYTLVEPGKETTKSAIIPATYYVAAADALTQTPVKLTGYSGSVSGGVYYKFGDFPQTIASNQDDNWYTPETVYNGWYLGSDGYFYEKCVENAYTTYGKVYYSDGTQAASASANSTKYFKVEPIVWRLLSSNYPDGKNLLFSEKILTADVPFCYHPTTSSNGSNISRRKVGNDPNILLQDYKYSTVRAYLNGSYESADTEHPKTYSGCGFLQKAFSSEAQDKISNTEIVYYTGQGDLNYTGKIKNKIFLLSQAELENSEYGFKGPKIDDNAKIKTATDYALANNFFAIYWTRTPQGREGNCINVVSLAYHYIKEQDSLRTHRTYSGIVPALCISSLP